MSRAPGQAADESFIEWLRRMAVEHAAPIREACALASSYMGALPPTGGSDMGVRMANRIGCLMSVQEAAAAEYLYRWTLSINQHLNHTQARARSLPSTGAFGAPHLIGL